MNKLLAWLLLIPSLALGADGANTVIGNPDPYIAWAMATSSSAATVATVLTNANDGVAHCFTSEKADTITDIGYHQGTTVGAGAAYTASLETSTTLGAPSGTGIGGVTATTFNPTGSGGANDNTWQWVHLSNTYTTTQGLELCIVIRRTAASDATTMGVNGGLTVSAHTGYPTYQVAAAGSWSRSVIANPLLAMKSAAAVYGRPWTGSTFATVNTSGGLVESGESFTIPSNFCSTAKLLGVRALIKTPSTDASNTYVATLYSGTLSGGNFTSPVRLDQSSQLIVDRFDASAGVFRQLELYFTTSTKITCGVTYGVALASTATGNASFYYTDVAAAGDWNAWGFKQNAAYITRTLSNTGNNTYAGIVAGTAAGDFTGTTTRRPYFELILDDVTVPSPAGF